MSIKSFGAVRMLNYRHIAITSTAALLAHFASSLGYEDIASRGSINRSTYRRADIYASMSWTMEALSLVAGRHRIYEIPDQVLKRMDNVIISVSRGG